jgi:uncharacterized membrane protein YdjX (TVP38/TMEM64 family)
MNAEGEEKAPASGPRAWLKPLLLVLLLGALLAAGWAFGLNERMKALDGWIASQGAGAPVAFVAVYILATVLMLPGTVLTLAAGGLFGSVLGTVCVSIGSTTGAALSFLIARYAARDTVGAWLQRNPRFARLDALTRQHGRWMVAVARLVPIFPFNLVNYGFGLTGVGFWTYILVSWACMLPGTILYVVGADALKQAFAGRISWPAIAALAGTLVFLVLVARRIRRKLNETPAASAVGEGAQP